jgi:hypothetical protein
LRRGDEFRKFRDNLVAYDGRVVLVAVTAPGADDDLPWDPEVCADRPHHRHSGPDGCRVVRESAAMWNETASERYATLWKAATMAANRAVRAMGYRGRSVVRVANVWSEQRRGVWHVHEALPARTPIELAWSRIVVEYLSRQGRVYGFGFVDRNPLGQRGRWTEAEGRGHERAARYLARNAATYLSENAAAFAEQTLPGRRLRSYVSRRLTSSTGVTMRNLRRVRHLWFCLTYGLGLPDWKPDELELVWRLLVGASVAPSGP